MTPATALVVVLGWTAATVLLWHLPTPRPPRLTSRAGRDERVTVVVPARDEERSLPDLLGDLAGQVGTTAAVVVVDDGSTDGTATVAEHGGAVVVDPGPPPPGWAGKPWACAAGVAASPTERVVLLDADVRLAPDALHRLVAEHDRRAPDGLLSVQPYHRVGSLAEEVSLMPNVVAVLASGVAAARPSARPGLAFGPCLVTTRTALAAAGGFEAVRGEVLEDAALAGAMERAGRTVAVLGGGETVAFRMFRDGGALVHGWTRTLAGGAGRARPLPLLGAVAWVAALVAVTVALRQPAPVVLGAYALTAIQVGWAARRVGSFHPLGAILFPLPLLAFLLLFGGSVLQHVRRRPVTWRGRLVPRP